MTGDPTLYRDRHWPTTPLLETTLPVSSERTSVGRVWLDLCLRYREAGVANDERRRMILGALMNLLEAEYPAEVTAEKALWTGGDAS